MDLKVMEDKCKHRTSSLPLRRDLDKTISLLDTQLNFVFDLLEHKVDENTQKNDSNHNYVDMYLALEQKFNQLQT